jgi:two-component system, OmpR family, phosphate regulon response regulator OmpR
MDPKPLLADAPHILVVDDDDRLRALVAQYLTTHDGFLVTACANVDQAKKALSWFQFQGMVVDIMMPGGSGTQLLDLPNAPPVLLLSAMDQIQDRIQGLERGARDYLTKPFDPRELSLRLKNILKRPRTGIRLGTKVYSLDTRILRHIGPDETPAELISLSAVEQALLEYFLSRPGQALDRQTIAQHVFCDAGNVRVVDVQVSRLRKKIEPNPAKPCFLISKRGQGYCLQGQEDVF